MTSRRQRDRAERQSGFWATKYAAAAGPQEQLEVTFDQLRAEITALPPREQEAAWRDALDHLARYSTVTAPNRRAKTSKESKKC